jgi:UPF0755 protein
MKKYLFFVLLLIIFITAIGFWLIFTPMEFYSDKEAQFSVKRGEGSKDIALNLEKQGLIRWAPAFRIYTLISGCAPNLKAGEYLFSPSMNIPEITDKLAKGDVIKISITIPEGFTVKQIEKRLGLELPGDNLEGFLFPDTYHFPFGFSEQEVIEKMQENFKRKLDSELRKEIERQGKTVFEVITMASLIEKEVKTLEDKKLISGILWKRLEINMLLQVDAAIAYVLEDVSVWDFNKMRREIGLARNIDSFYNTYKYLGLPPGPICNPGLESIRAAIYPQESDYWYYLSTPEGQTIFSKTLQEHNLAIAEHLR